MRTVFVALRALVFASGFLFLWGWLALSLRIFDQRFEVQFPWRTTLAGIILMAVGGILVLACIGVFVMWGHGTPAVFDPPRAFVAVGPYRYVRNPMYLGGWLLLLGFGLWKHSPSMLVFGLPWIFLAHLFVVYVEEPGLQRKFGETYEAYCKAVNRWIPKR
ncbi:MAG TPA: isoprenylcysteine carboxylmethyltransferase family protein [Terriglobia bacterium]|nr:isoprenylcysteine carboxylmethyltransferase family protein [Terriglobia bacterium]